MSEIKEPYVVSKKGDGQVAEIETYGSRQEIQEFAYRLKHLVAGGKRLTDDEAIALAQYAYATTLDPFAGECYYLPGMGPGPGIAGWRRKADEQLEFEAQKAREPTARFWCEYVEPEPDEAKWDPIKGDIAVKAILHDTLTRSAWEKRTLSHYIDLVKAGMDGKAWEIARELAGPEPVWTAVGVVHGSENFGSVERMERYERACKRAEKPAIRKRFPRLHLVEPEGFDVGVDVIEGEFLKPASPETSRSEAEQLNELGYPPDDQSNASETTGTRPKTLAERLVEAKLFDNVQSAARIIKKLDLDKIAEEMGQEEAFKQAHGYRGFRDLNFSSDQAVAKIKLGEFPK